MRNTKMLAALLAGLITLSLAGCGADKTENTGSDPASTESGITATVTDKASEPTAESSLPAENETKADEPTAEKEKAESNAPADSGSKADTKKPAESNQQTKDAVQADGSSEACRGKTANACTRRKARSSCRNTYRQ